MAFAMEIIEETDEEIRRRFELDQTQLEESQTSLRECLTSNYLKHSGIPPKHSSYANETLADYAWSDTLPVLRLSKKPAARAAVQLAKAQLAAITE
jgi:hypothetical protein